ncbi:MAG: bifunctional riboflavin kinase/FAD synthetase [Clostridia bacterium]|nr:bifunctional riboflavin kinase/FAD synthetase [Clostridia bacterium]
MSLTEKTKTAVALGSFDGLHKGHTAVIASALSMRASGLFPVVLLFDEHPQKILGTAPDEILQKHLRRKLLENMGIEIVDISFSSICKMTAEDFFKDILLNELNAGALCCGENYRFGAGGKGNCAVLEDLCRKSGTILRVSESVMSDGEPVSSTRIRTAIKKGDIISANTMLGRPFFYDGEVTHGDRRGRKMGFPTANQFFEEGFIVPDFGVYASTVRVGETEYCGITNIGVRPTFGKSVPRSETHIENFSDDIYGENIEIRLFDKIRDETKFSSMEELARQIKNDSETAKRIFKKKGENACV